MMCGITLTLSLSEREKAFYNELCSAMLEHSGYEGGYVMQCSEHREGGCTFASFIMRERLSTELV